MLDGLVMGVAVVEAVEAHLVNRMGGMGIPRQGLRILLPEDGMRSVL